MTMYLHEHREVRYAPGGSCLADPAEEPVRLDYYLYESEDDWEIKVLGNEAAAVRLNLVSYGIGVTESGRELFEEKFVKEVTNDKSAAINIVGVIADNLVTPCCLSEVLEEICAIESTVV